MTFAEFKILAQKHGLGLWHILQGVQAKRGLTAVIVLFALPIFGVLTAFGVSSDSQLDRIERHDITENLALPKPEEAALALSERMQFRASDRVQRGDTVAVLLQRLNVNDNAAFNFLRTENPREAYSSCVPDAPCRPSPMPMDRCSHSPICTATISFCRSHGKTKHSSRKK